MLSLFSGRGERVVFIFQALKTLTSAARLLALPHRKKRKEEEEDAIFFSPSSLFFYPVGDFLQDLCWNLIVAATIVLCCCGHGAHQNPAPSSRHFSLFPQHSMLPRLVIFDTQTTFGSDGRAGWLTVSAPGLGL